MRADMSQEITATRRFKRRKGQQQRPKEQAIFGRREAVMWVNIEEQDLEEVKNYILKL
jgi:hypothetical protein